MNGPIDPLRVALAQIDTTVGDIAGNERLIVGAIEAARAAEAQLVLLFSDERLTSDLRELAERTAGKPDPALEAAGQAVLLDRRPNMKVPVTAVTSKRLLQAAAPDDAKLQAFIEFWLGKAS
jgi:hypothetical protein